MIPSSRQLVNTRFLAGTALARNKSPLQRVMECVQNERKFLLLVIQIIHLIFIELRKKKVSIQIH